MAKHDEMKAKKADSAFLFISCQVEPGMFRDEWLVYVTAVDPANPERSLRVQLLVDQREVVDLRGTPRRNKPVAGHLRVAVAGKEKGYVHVVLPQPAASVGENIFVDERQTKEYAGA